MLGKKQLRHVRYLLVAKEESGLVGGGLVGVGGGGGVRNVTGGVFDVRVQ